jgi:hypothetical protein
MILDTLTGFCNNLAVTNAAKYSTDDSVSKLGTSGAGYIDLGNTDAFASDGTEYFGVGEPPLYVVAGLNALMNDAGTPRTITLAVTLETADDSAFTSNLTTIMTLGTFAAGSAAGSRFVQALPVGVKFRRYIRLKFTPSGTLTGGTVYGFMAKDVDGGQNYPSRTTN